MGVAFLSPPMYRIGLKNQDTVENEDNLRYEKNPQKLRQPKVYGTPQSKQSKTPERWRNFFLRPPLKIAQKCLSLQFFLHIPINHDVQASEKI